MDSLLENYGRVILCIIVITCSLAMFVNFLYGGDSLFAVLINDVMQNATDDMTVTSTGDDGGFAIQSQDGTVYAEQQQGSAIRQEEIASRDDATLHAAGEQNQDTQLLIHASYHTSELFWAKDSDGVIINTVLSDASSDAHHYFLDDANNGKGYLRPLSISMASGAEIISNLSDLDGSYSIAYQNQTYPNKIGAAGANSNISGTTFHIYDEHGNAWFTYDVATQTWCFEKSGTYCIRVLVCDAKGKSTIGVVYLSIAKRLT